MKGGSRNSGKSPGLTKIIVKTPKDLINEADKIKQLEKENRKLKELIGQQQVEIVYKDQVIKQAKIKIGEDFEKK